jgi:glycosyltransferase involved in cell wall biosynthesis
MIFSANSLKSEIIVVDDGSKDDTKSRTEEYCQRDTRVRTVCHPNNRGYGAALKSGILASKGDLIFFTDADLQFDIAELESLLVHAGNHDIIAGFRAVRSDPLMRRLNAWGWGKVVNALFELEVKDVDCAFKVFKRRVFEAIPIHSVGAFVNTEILVRAKAAGFSIKQLPVSHYPRAAGEQSGADFRVIAKAFSELYRLRGDLNQSNDGQLGLLRVQ